MSVCLCKIKEKIRKNKNHAILSRVKNCCLLLKVIKDNC